MDETRVRADAERGLLQPRDDAEAGCAKDVPSFGCGDGGPPKRGTESRGEELALLPDAPECGLDSDVRGTGRAAQGRQGRPGGHPSRSHQQPPRPARPPKGAVAIVARGPSSSPCTSSGSCSSCRPGRSRASWTRDASRPEGVRQNSPGLALHLGHRPCSPAVCDVERRRLRCCPIAPWQPASRTRGRATCRAPVLEAQSAVTHRALRADPSVAADDVTQLRSVGIGRTWRSAGDHPGQTKVSPGNAAMQRRSFSVHIPSTSFISAGFRPPQPFTQTSSGLQGFRAR